ncbi:hypothetical protein [Rickettsia akari]|uniref:hypothetical protein n=1 Tax=Rickettsia akari TaxID=786 RepID=UPI00004620CA|nr:hypothetical protein [Rickettsia akari]
MSTGAGLVGGVFNNGDIIQTAVVGLGIKISEDKANAVVGGINTLIALPAFGMVEVSQNVSIGPLKFISNNVTSIITGVSHQTCSNIDFAGKNSTLQINNGLNIRTHTDNTVARNNGIRLLQVQRVS